MSDSLFGLTSYLLVLSLLAVGGLNGMLPELHRIIVEQEGWLTTQQFSELFALCQAAPGPGLGWRRPSTWSPTSRSSPIP